MLPQRWVSKSVEQLPNTLSDSIIPAPIQTRNTPILENNKEFPNTPLLLATQQKGGVVQGQTREGGKNALSESLFFSKEFYMKCLKGRLNKQMRKCSKLDDFVPKGNQNKNCLLSKDDVEKILSDNTYRLELKSKW